MLEVGRMGCQNGWVCQKLVGWGVKMDGVPKVGRMGCQKLVGWGAKMDGALKVGRIGC